MNVGPRPIATQEGLPTVNINIDGHDLSVPTGTLLIDVAKSLDIDVPHFCYHPRLEPVGMCRQCLVETGIPQRDRESGELVTNDDGDPVIQWAPKVTTACTYAISPRDAGLQVLATSESARKAQEEVNEFLLINHPLD